MKYLVFALIVSVSAYSAPASIYKGLNLSEAQRTELKALKEEKKSLKDSQQAVKTAKEDLEKSLKNKEIEESEIIAKAEALAELNKKNQLQRIQDLLKIRKILNPEQFAKYINSLKKNQ